MDEMQHAVVRSPEADLLQHGIRFACEISVGKEQKLDDRDKVSVGPRFPGKFGSGCFDWACARAERRCGYVSHVDLFEADC
jgi:hypothetical protein